MLFLKGVRVPIALRFLLLVLLLASCLFDVFGGGVSLEESKFWFEFLLIIKLVVVIFLFLETRYMTAFMGLGMLVAFYAALAVNFADNPFGVWYFSSYSWDDSDFIRKKGLHAMSLGESVFLFLGLLFSGVKFKHSRKSIRETISINTLKVVSIVFLLLSIPTLELTTTGLVSSVGYMQANVQSTVAIQSSGLKVMGIFFVISSLVVICTSTKRFWGGLNSLIIVGGIFLMVYYQFLRGERSGSLGYFAVLLVMFFRYGRMGSLKKLVLTPILSLVLIIVLLAVGTIRHAASRIGLYNAILFSWEVIQEDYLPSNAVYKIDSGSNYIDADLLSAPTQMYWHTLSVIHLRHQGKSLNGRSFVDLIPQALPKFLTDPIGFERPTNGALRLMKIEHMRHGGGMYIFALGLWNYGVPGVIITAIFFSLIVFLFEILSDFDFLLASVPYFTFASTFLEGLYYGWQPLSKNLQFAILQLVVFILLIYLGKKLRALNSVNSSY